MCFYRGIFMALFHCPILIRIYAKGVIEINIFEIFGTIRLDDSEYIRDFDRAMGKAESFGQKFGGIVADIGKAVAVGVGAAATAFTALTTQSVKSYADYEQFVGGIETLFGDSSDIVMQYAEDAYKTANLSANEYMDTITSFSASLLQGLGGDTKQAAEMGNMAVLDMADKQNTVRLKRIELYQRCAA